MRRDNDRNHIMSKSSLFVGILILVAISACDAGQQRSIRCRVTYCTSAQIYFDGGKEEGLSVGDTLVIARGDTSVGSAVITGISSHSSVSRALVTLLPPRIGDIGTLMKEGNLPALPPTVSDSTTVVSPLCPPSPPDVERKPGENVLAARGAFQYIGQ